MGLSLGCCVIAYLNYDFALSFDRNHENIDSIYKIHTNKEVQGDKIHYGITPVARAPSLENQYSAIKKNIEVYRRKFNYAKRR